MKLIFTIDAEKLETRKWVKIKKDIYAKKIADSIEIYEIKPVVITPEDRESISKAINTLDHCKDELELPKKELGNLIRLRWDLYYKYCKNCADGVTCLWEDECEFADLWRHSLRRGEFSGAVWEEVGDTGRGSWRIPKESETR